jgi:hypothetical protein
VVSVAEVFLVKEAVGLVLPYWTVAIEVPLGLYDVWDARGMLNMGV